MIKYFNNIELRFRMSSLLRRFLIFWMLKVLFPDFLELRVFFGLYTEEDFKRMICESTHLIRDVMIPIEPQAGAQLGCLFRRATVSHREYGSFRSGDDAFICHWLRNQVLVITQTRLLLQHFLGVNYQRIHHPYHPMRRAVASTIKHIFDSLLKPVIELQDSISLRCLGGLGLGMQRLNQPSRRETAKLLPFELMYGSDVVHFQIFSSDISYPVFDALRRLVVPFLTRKPNLQMNDSEMAVLIIWAAKKILEIYHAENAMFGLREIVCLSDDRTPTESLRSMSPQTLMILATCNGGILLSTAIKRFSSQKIFCIKQETKIALERSQICAIPDSANQCFQFKPSQRAPQRAPQRAAPGPLIPYD